MVGCCRHHPASPPLTCAITGEDEIARTLPALHATGYRVDVEHWADAAYPCCPPNPCVAKVIEQTQVAQCIGDTGAPPPATGASGKRGA